MSNRVEWDPRHDMGNEILDAQHRELLTRCNALADFVAADDPDADRHFDAALDELMALARQHFATEETLLAARGFPGLDARLNEREEFDYLAAEIITTDNFDKGELQTFLSLWWAGHIAGSASELRICLQDPPAA